MEEIKSVMKTTSRMKKSEDLSDLAEELYKMKRKLCKQVDSEQRKIENRKTLPKPILPIFNSDRLDTYLDFRYSMPPCLIYESEHLNVSTLLNSVKGTQKQKVLDSVKHKTTTKRIWKTWDAKYGCIDISQSDLLKKLKTMTVRPKTD